MKLLKDGRYLTTVPVLCWWLVDKIGVWYNRSHTNKQHSVLDRIATDTLYAAAFSQEAEIQVDKAGTIAKARTCMTLCLKGGISHSDEFIFNKPFRYFLRNTNTGEILFMGKVNQLADCKRQSYSIDISRWH